MVKNNKRGKNFGEICFYGAMAVINTYLVFLQRYHRVRICNVLGKMEKKK